MTAPARKWTSEPNRQRILFWIEADDSDIAATPEELRLAVDAFRESIRPSSEYGLVIYEANALAGVDDVAGFVRAVESMRLALYHVTEALDGLAGLDEEPLSPYFDKDPGPTENHNRTALWAAGIQARQALDALNDTRKDG